VIPSRRAKVEETLRELTLMAEQDLRGIAELRAATPGTPIIQVPRFELDVHDVAALWRTGRYLMGDEVIPTVAPPTPLSSGEGRGEGTSPPG